jgi:low affinity Fe/Cu permease
MTAIDKIINHFVDNETEHDYVTIHKDVVREIVRLLAELKQLKENQKKYLNKNTLMRKTYE